MISIFITIIRICLVKMMIFVLFMMSDLICFEFILKLKLWFLLREVYFCLSKNSSWNYAMILLHLFIQFTLKIFCKLIYIIRNLKELIYFMLPLKHMTKRTTHSYVSLLCLLHPKMKIIAKLIQYSLFNSLDLQLEGLLLFFICKFSCIRYSIFKEFLLSKFDNKDTYFVFNIFLIGP